MINKDIFLDVLRGKKIIEVYHESCWTCWNDHQVMREEKDEEVLFKVLNLFLDNAIKKGYFGDKAPSV